MDDITKVVIVAIIASATVAIAAICHINSMNPTIMSDELRQQICQEEGI